MTMSAQSVRVRTSGMLHALALVPGLAAALPAIAQEYPSKTIRVITAFTPGGTSDIVARLSSQMLSDAFGRPSVVENRPGAGGTVGTELAAKSAPDGYTLVIGHIGTLAVNPTLYPKIGYDPVRDFAAITLISKAPSIMVVHPSLPVKTVKEFIALARKRPGALEYGSPGSGSAGHLLMSYLTLLSKTELLHVPYKGTAPALVDLMAGRISTVFTGTPGILPHVQAGRLRIIGVSSAQRLASMPDVPTIAESGLPGFDVTQWWGILAPAGTPRPIVMRLNEVFEKALRSPEMLKRLAADGAEPAHSTPEAFQAFIKSEVEKWAPVIRASGAKVE
jgi:tripartite-type tricarboxylate transporter receptor subunit TctC